MLYFVTGNKHKVTSAALVPDTFHIPFVMKDISLTEIQSSSMEEITQRKGEEAFRIIPKPLVVKDDGWYITALNGFPGPYMRYINEWFTEKDFLNLLQDKPTREIIFCEVVCYIDKTQTKLFLNKLRARLRTEPIGNGSPFTRLVTFREDNKSMAECENKKIPFYEEKSVWDMFASWYKKTIF